MSELPPADELTHGEKVLAALYRTRVEMDHRVQSVLNFMEQTLQADDLRGVAEAVATIAPAVWGQFRHERVNAAHLVGLLR